MTKLGRKSEIERQILDIADHPELLALYAHIAEVRAKPASLTCHIYTGNKANGVPRIKVHGKMMRMSDFYAPFFGLPTGGKKQCTTIGCFNPYHYVFDPREEEHLRQTDDGVNDLIQYVIDSRQLLKEQINFNHLRPLLDIAEVTDTQLHHFLEQL